MTRPTSRAARKAAFMKQAEAMFEELEDWYDENQAATFEEIERRARQARRKMMGESLGIMINGRDVGKTEEAPRCEKSAASKICGLRKYEAQLTKKVTKPISQYASTQV